MAYNKANEERKWLAWKEAEEKKLRELGVDEFRIQELHEYDWKMFKDERNYYRHIQETGSYLETLFASEDQKEIRTVEDLLDEIENPSLYEILKNESTLTLRILVLKINGFSSKEISNELGLSVTAIDLRIWYLKQKIKNI